MSSTEEVTSFNKQVYVCSGKANALVSYKQAAFIWIFIEASVFVDHLFHSTNKKVLTQNLFISKHYKKTVVLNTLQKKNTTSPWRLQVRETLLTQ